jgi:hypothetical protein
MTDCPGTLPYIFRQLLLEPHTVGDGQARLGNLLARVREARTQGVPRGPYPLAHIGARRTQRYRLPTRPLSPSHIKREEALKRQVWTHHRAWSRISSGVLLHVIGAVQYGTSKVFY